VNLNLSNSVWFKRSRVESPQYTDDDYEFCQKLLAGGIDIEEDGSACNTIKFEDYLQSQNKKKVRFAKMNKIESKPIKEWQVPKIERSLLIDIEVGNKMLVALFDMGSDVDIISERIIQRHKFPIRRENVDISLQGAGLSQKPIGKITHSTTLPLQLVNQKAEQWPMWVANIRHDVILGLPWIRAHQVEIDWVSYQISIEGVKTPFKVRPASPVIELSAVEYVQELQEEGATRFIVWLNDIETPKKENEIPFDIKELLEEYKDRFPDPIPGVKFANLPPNAAKDRGDLNHKIPLIDENERPYFQHPRPLASIELGILKERIRDLIRLGHIQRSRSPWGAPILFVKKKDGTLQMCVDYRRLNKLTIKDVYPLPLINTMIDKLKKAQYFTKIDLDGAYHQIRVKLEDIPKTAFNCELGHYEFTVMTFGFSNAPATFQRIMNEIFHTEENSFIIVYLDDILIFSETWREHLKHIKWTLDKLKENSLFAKMKKCEWGTQEVEYLGHIIRPGQIAMDPKKIQAVMEWPVPQTIKNIQAFLGLANFYRRFVYRFSQIATPLTELTKLEQKWNWTESCQKAFDQLKAALTTAPVLQIYNPEKETRTEHDASDFAWAGILSEETPSIKEVSTVKSEFFQAWIPFYQKDAALKLAYDLAKSHPEQAKDFQIINGMLRRKGKLCVPAGLPRESILREHHDAPMAGHPGIKKTYKKIKEDYYWSGMKKDVETYITKCDSCQKK
jgi:hypothetical protein